MQGSNILEENLVFVIDEINRFHELKESIRKKIKTQLNNFEKKKKSVEQQRTKCVDKFTKNLSNNSMNKFKKSIAVGV